MSDSAMSSEKPESWYRDLLAVQVSGQAEAPLPFGSADVMTATTVYEVEPVIHWRDGVRQVLATQRSAAGKRRSPFTASRP